MPRTVGFVAIALLTASLGTAARAQVPSCDKDAILKDLHAGKFPWLVGCPIGFAPQANKRLDNRFKIDATPQPVAAVKPGMIIAQSQDGSLVRLTVAERPKEPTPTPAPGPNPGPTATAISFAISGAAPVQEGKPLVFKVTRSGDDGQAHQVRLEYRTGANLLVDPPPVVRFEAGDPPEKEVVVQTAPGQSGDGDHNVEVSLARADDVGIVGSPGSATATILDTPKPPAVPVAYKIAFDGPPVNRGSDLHFTVTRTGPLSALRLEYKLEGGDGELVVESPTPRYVDFGQGVDRASLTIASDQYGVCGNPPSVILADGAGTRALAQFADPPPRGCGEEPPVPWWQLILIWLRDHPELVAGAVVVAAAAGLAWYFRPFIRVTPSCDLKAGGVGFEALEAPVSRWPEIHAEVVLEPGELSVTQPLPRSEGPNG